MVALTPDPQLTPDHACMAGSVIKFVLAVPCFLISVYWASFPPSLPLSLSLSLSPQLPPLVYLLPTDRLIDHELLPSLAVYTNCSFTHGHTNTRIDCVRSTQFIPADSWPEYMQIDKSNIRLSHATVGLIKGLQTPKGRGHATAILSCVPSKIQWFVTNYSNSCCLNFTMHIEDFYYFQIIILCEFCQVPSCMPSSPLRVYKPLV